MCGGKLTPAVLRKVEILKVVIIHFKIKWDEEKNKRVARKHTDNRHNDKGMSVGRNDEGEVFH